MSETIREKQRRVRQQGFAAAKKDNGIYPRELQNVPGDRWEDAKVYNKNTRQGQNHWQDHMKTMSQLQRNKQAGQTQRSGSSGTTKQKQNEQNSGRNNELLRKRQREVLENAFNKKR